MCWCSTPAAATTSVGDGRRPHPTAVGCGAQVTTTPSSCHCRTRRHGTRGPSAFFFSISRSTPTASAEEPHRSEGAQRCVSSGPFRRRPWDPSVALGVRRRHAPKVSKRYIRAAAVIITFCFDERRSSDEPSATDRALRQFFFTHHPTSAAADGEGRAGGGGDGMLAVGYSEGPGLK